MQMEVVSFHIAELQAEAAEQILSLSTATLASRWGMRLLVAVPIFCSLGNVSSLFFFISDFILFYFFLHKLFQNLKDSFEII